MTTPFALLCQGCGLSHREAASWLDVRLDTVKSWSSGRNPTPPGVIEALAGLADTIDQAADAAVEQIAATVKAQGEPETVEIGLAATDRKARSLGWPCLGAHRAVVALTLARAMAEGRNVTLAERQDGDAFQVNAVH